MSQKRLARQLRAMARVRPMGKEAFLLGLPIGATILDVGCGNESPSRAKALRPDCRYIGIDIEDYNQTSQNYADEYVLCAPEEFNSTIERFRGTVDAVVSSHNIEHCDAPVDTLRVMCEALRPGGSLFIAWPCEESVRFPSRGGLNFYDDDTHQQQVPTYEVVRQTLARSLKIVREDRRSRPLMPFIVGAVLEPISAATRRVMPFRSTWALYGFESIIWAKRLT